MTVAPHSNTDVQRQLRAGMTPTELPLVLGSFVETEHGLTHEFAERRWADDEFAPEMPHIIFTRDGNRLARVLKTVAYVVVDEDAEGNPVVEKWSISHHRVYDTEWVRA